MKTVNLGPKNQKDVLEKAKITLDQGGLVVSPSDTVYGLLVRADRDRAVKKLINFKNRPPGKPISIFLASIDQIANYAFLSKRNTVLIKKILPGPYTVVLNSKHRLSPFLEAEKGTLGIRVIRNSFINQLLKKTAYPLTATSANLSSHAAVYSVGHFLNRLSKDKQNEIDLIIDNGSLPRNKPSTVIDLSGEKIKILRKGSRLFHQKIKKTSASEVATRKIAANLVAIVKKKINEKPVVIIFRGPLGTGKTVFVKGIGEALGIKRIISPTFVIYYQYSLVDKSIKQLYHFDLYRLNEIGELKNLKIGRLLKKGNLICIEWGEKVAVMINELRRKAFLIEVRMEYLDEKRRIISISYDDGSN